MIRGALRHPSLHSGLTAGAILVFLGLVGFLEAFRDDALVAARLGDANLSLSVGRAVILALFVWAGARAGTLGARAGRPHRWTLGYPAGLLAAGLLACFVWLGRNVDLRAIFPKASPALYEMLAFDGLLFEGWTFTEVALLLLVGSSLAQGGHLLGSLPPLWRRRIAKTLLPVLALGLFAEQILLVLAHNDVDRHFRGWLFLRSGGLAAPGALLVAGLALLLALAAERGWGPRRLMAGLPPARRRAVGLAGWPALALAVLVLPRVLGTYHSDVLNTVGIYALMGLGLNIVVGFAGMLDLGYVAFFALGAYTSAVLTSKESFLAPCLRLVDGVCAEHGPLTGFWSALPAAILVAGLGGLLLGVPVLKMRGDYLAIITLGFGEIIRILAQSDWLRPYLGGSQGIAGIAPATLPLSGIEVSGPHKPQLLFYLVLAGCLLAIFVARRLRDSRLGRAWMAIREDEDVAEAMGIRLVQTKLMAFGTGAALAGLAGLLFGTKLTTIYPHSFSLMVSINILALIIVGGMGSISGVLVGALVLVGLPELLRDFQDFRWMAFGALLVWMMLNRPEGLLPDAERRRELRAGDDALTA